MKKIISCVLALMFWTWLAAQNSEVVKWTYVSKKIADKTYEVHLTPNVQSPWHIYSQTSPEGGAIPTKIVFNKNPLVTVDGKTKEVGKIISKYEDVFEVTVKYFEGKADFVQIVKLKANAKTNISGSIEYMACNDEQCTPPQKVNFNIALQ